MIDVRLTQDAHAAGGPGMFYRFHTSEGRPAIGGISDAWYTAIAEDAGGNQYEIVWEITDPDADEDSICDWDTPASVIAIDDNNKDVTEMCRITNLYHTDRS